MIEKGEFQTLAVCSVRYALGRMSYVVSEVAEIIKNNKERLDKNTIEVILRDIKEEMVQAARKGDFVGMDMDHKVWSDLYNLLSDYLESRKDWV